MIPNPATCPGNQNTLTSGAHVVAGYPKLNRHGHPMGVCVFCGDRCVSGGETVLCDWRSAPDRPHHHLLPPGIWLCPRTGIDHDPVLVYVVRRLDSEVEVQCSDCEALLTQWTFNDSASDATFVVYLSEYVIHEVDDLFG